MRRPSGTWLRWTALLLLSLEAAGCALFGGPPREAARAEARELERKARDTYFFNWPAAVTAARAAVERDPDGAPLARFIVGEASYLAGDQEAAFPHLLAALRGGDPVAALAAMHLVRDLYVSRSVALELASLQPSCGTLACRGVIAAESLEWARATQRSWERRRIERQVFWPRELRLFRAAGGSAFRDLAAVSTEEEAYRRGDQFVPASARRVELPETVSAIDLRNHFTPVRNSVFFASGTVTMPEAGAVAVLPYVTVPYRLYVDGAVVMERDADRLSVGVVSGLARIELSKGTHTVLLKLAPHLSEEGYAAVLFFRQEGPTLPDGTDIAFPRDGDDPVTAYLRLLARDLLFADARLADWEERYASVNGSRSPGPLLWTSRAYRREGNGQGAASLLSFLSKEWPDLVLLKSDLIENCQDIGDDACVRRTIEAEEGRQRDELAWMLRLSDHYYAKRWYAKDLANAERLAERYERYPVAYYYLSDSWRGIGDNGHAARVRQRAVPLIPAYLPTLSRLAELYREAGDLPALVRTARRLIEIDPYSKEHHRTLGDAYASEGSWGRAERVFREALEHDPEAHELWARLGDVLALDGRAEEAVAAFRRACALAPESLEYAERLDAFGAADTRFFTENALGDAQVDAKIAAFRAEAAKYPQKYTIVYDEGLQQVHYNGSARLRARLVIALNTEEGVREFTTVANYGRIVTARVVKPDGHSAPSWRADASTLYFLDTEPGDVIDFTMETSEGPRPWIGGTDFRWFFASEGVFNLHSRLVLRAPADMPVSFFTRGPVRREERVKDGAREYLFETTALYQAPREEAMPPLIDLLPILAYTTVPSWDDFARWHALFIREQEDDDGDIGRIVPSLVAGAADPIARVGALRDWVARQVRYLADDRGIAKVRPGNVMKTFTDKAGDCKDKALLLKTMLRHAGIASRYALVKSRGAGALLRDLPSMQFDHALLFVPSQEGIAEGFFVDATAGYDHFRGINPEVAGAEAFVVDEATGDYRFERVADHLESTVSLLMGEDGTARLSLSGAAASNARYRFAADGDPFAHIAGLVTRMAGGPVTVTQCTLSAGQYAEPFEAVCAVRPFFPALVAAVLGKLAEPQERRYPLYLGDRIVRWHAEMKGTAAAEPAAAENEFFAWRVERTEGGVAVLLELKTTEIPAERYAAFRAAVEQALAIENGMRGALP